MRNLFANNILSVPNGRGPVGLLPKPEPFRSWWFRQDQEGTGIARKSYSAEDIVINKLLPPPSEEAEVLIAGGTAIELACKLIGITDQTSCKWRREYGGLKTD